MKLNRKVIIPAFTLLVGAALAGSVSSTVAWYQYSTRTNVSYIGSSAGTTGNLQIRIKGAAGEAGKWGTRLSIQDVSGYLLAQGIGQEVEPVTPGALAKDGSLKKFFWQEKGVASIGQAAPNNNEGNEGDFYFDEDHDKLYQKGQSEWAIFNAAIKEAAPDVNNYDLGSLIFNKADNKVYKAALKAEWQEIEINSGSGEPSGEPNQGRQYYIDLDENKLYSYKFDENHSWEEVNGVDVVAVEPDVYEYAFGDMYINSAEGKLFKASLGAENRDFYLNPQIGFGSYDKWFKASTANYVKIPLQLRFMEGKEENLTAEDVYLSKLLIQKDTVTDNDAANHGDISDAIRVHFSAYADGDEGNAVNHLVSKKGGTSLTHGKLRLGNGSDFDKAYADGDEFGFEGSNYEYVNYGGAEGKQVCYGAFDEEKQGYYYEEEISATGWEKVAVATAAAADPDVANFEEGDFYFNTGSSELYQLESGVWVLFAEDFESGAEDPDLESVIAKDYYFASESKTLFARSNPEPVEETIAPALVKNIDNSLEISGITAEKLIGSTIATEAPQKYLNVDVTIWVEGWHKFNREGSYTSIWDSNLIGAMFDVGMQFAVQER